MVFVFAVSQFSYSTSGMKGKRRGMWGGSGDREEEEGEEDEDMPTGSSELLYCHLCAVCSSCLFVCVCEGGVVVEGTEEEGMLGEAWSGHPGRRPGGGRRRRRRRKRREDILQLLLLLPETNM